MFCLEVIHEREAKATAEFNRTQAIKSVEDQLKDAIKSVKVGETKMLVEGISVYKDPNGHCYLFENGEYTMID